MLKHADTFGAVCIIIIIGGNHACSGVLCLSDLESLPGSSPLSHVPLGTPVVLVTARVCLTCVSMLLRLTYLQ